jgi:dTDP-4-amino-4,6-dideoxygalactose transaminase
MNSRLDTIQAAILLAKFDVFVKEELDAVNRVADQYTELLSDIVDTPTIKKGFFPVGYSIQ